MRYHLLMARQNLTELAQHGAFARMNDLIHRRQQRLDDLLYRLAHAERDALERARRRCDTLAAAARHYDVRRMLAGIGKELEARTAAMSAAARSALMRRRARIEQLSGQLEALSPLAILGRGYALVFDAAGNLLKDAAQVKMGEDISARLARGSLTATVKSKIS
jgi:exodeoxyribonuclease VII large subunit